jgi:uncharacterized membrane protein YhhN
MMRKIMKNKVLRLQNLYFGLIISFTVYLLIIKLKIEQEWLKFFVKPIFVILLALLVYLVWDRDVMKVVGDVCHIRVLICVGLFLSVGGDIFMLKSENDLFLGIGGGLFMMAHIIYGAAYFTLKMFKSWLKLITMSFVQIITVIVVNVLLWPTLFQKGLEHFIGINLYLMMEQFARVIYCCYPTVIGGLKSCPLCRLIGYIGLLLFWISDVILFIQIYKTSLLNLVFFSSHFFQSFWSKSLVEILKWVECLLVMMFYYLGQFGVAYGSRQFTCNHLNRTVKE